jgi:hypothetical protein
VAAIAGLGWGQAEPGGHRHQGAAGDQTKKDAPGLTGDEGLGKTIERSGIHRLPPVVDANERTVPGLTSMLGTADVP